MAQPQDKRFVLESRVDSLVANELRNPVSTTRLELLPVVAAGAADAVANNPGVVSAAASAAASAAQSTANLVKKNDAGIPKTLVGADSTDLDSEIWRNKFYQKIMSITKDNYLRLFKGLQIGPSKFTNDPKTGDYLFAHRDRNGRIAESVYLANGNKPQEVLDRWKARMGLGSIITQVNTVVTVKPDGTGNYLSPKLANDAFVPGPGKTLEVIIYPGRYTETEWTVKEGVTLRGTNRDRCILDGSLPASATDTQVTNTSTIWLTKTATIENLTILARNMRYCVHAEAGGLNPDAIHTVKNCWIEHFGNQDVVDYRVANALPAGVVWASDRAWGYGSSSGWYQRFENVTFVSRRDAWYVHDNKDFAKPMNHDFFGCRLISRETDGLLSLQSLGSGVDSRVNVYNCETSFNMVYDSDTPWITEDPAKQVSNHRQIFYTQNGLNPVGFQSGHRGKALKIESNSTTTSTVRVSGTAATVLFGDPVIRDGGGGLKGYAAGYWDISGILVGLSSNIAVNNTIGKRLGDCSVVNKTLAVTVDGGAPVNVVFNTNLTAETNANIIATINTALGSTAVASEYDIAAGENYPFFPDRELYAKNVGATGIPRFNAVRKTTNRGEVDLIATTDTVDKFYAVALENIPPGKFGRILISGLLRQPSNQIPGVTTQINAGASIYLSDTVAGQFSTAGTRKVMTAGPTHWAKFEGTK